MNIKEFESSLTKGTKIYQVYEILKDYQWHCRECEYTHTGITQIAGGSGIQGLQRGTGSRAGLQIESDNHFCQTCNRITRQDRWEGQFELAMQSGSMPRSFVERVVKLLGKKDVVENVERTTTQMTIDHKLPNLRWNEETRIEQTDYGNMTDEDIQAHFQLLKKSNGAVSHNLLKSRACEKCYRSGKRGYPFGIKFFYHGDIRWAPSSKNDASGCIGCGWFDFAKWREELNKKFSESNQA